MVADSSINIRSSVGRVVHTSAAGREKLLLSRTILHCDTGFRLTYPQSS